MLEKVDLTQSIPKKEYKRIMPDLQNRMYSVQKASWDAGIPVLVVFEGWHASGMGRAMRKLLQPLDPRGFKLHTIRGARRFERRRPWMWRFWIKLPAYGEWALFDRSWYGRVLNDRMENVIPEAKWRRAYRDIVDFERTIADDDHLIIKLFLHISKEEQKLRLEKRGKKPSKTWRVSPKDWAQNLNYEAWADAFEEMFERTDTEWGPWAIIPATDRRYTHLKIYKTILDAMEESLGIAQPEPNFETVPQEDSQSSPQAMPESSPQEATAADQEREAAVEEGEVTSSEDKILSESSQA